MTPVRDARRLVSFPACEQLEVVDVMGDYYKQLLSGFGYADECDEIARLYVDKATRKMAPDAVTDDMIEALTISGDLIYCRREIARRRELGMEQPIINLPPGMAWPGMAPFITALARAQHQAERVVRDSAETEAYVDGSNWFLSHR